MARIPNLLIKVLALQCVLAGFFVGPETAALGVPGDITPPREDEAVRVSGAST